MIEKKNFYINGSWVAPKNPKDIQVINPATEKSCAVISLGGKEDVNDAVLAAKEAFKTWGFSSKEERLSLLESFYALYKKRWNDITDAIIQEMGAPKDFALKLQTGTGASHTKSFIRYLKEFEFEKPLGEHAKNQRLIYEPKGVCALITPWNWPINQVTLKVIPALASGCTMVLKPSELAPLSAMIIAELIDEAKFPKGVFNLVNGDGAGVGTHISSHPDIDMVSFTGSTRAGRDADAEAIERGALRCFRNSGQSCNAPTRMLVEKPIYDEAVERLRKYASEFKVDDPNKEGEHIGPVISETQFNKIQGLIQKGIDEGAKLVAGGPGKPDGLSDGYYVKPTVFADVNNDMEIARTEIFGPVLSVIPFETEEEAIQIANDTDYGLTNYIQTQDNDKVQRVARKLRSGMVDVNGAGIAVDAPFGGFKHSGIGREAGKEGLLEFLEVKSVGGWN